MIVLAIDPGFDRIGWAAAQVWSGDKINLLSFGLIETNKKDDVFVRFRQIDQEITSLITEFGVQEAALESLFFFRNKTTVIRVAEARGIMLAALIRAGVKLFEYSPPQIKMAVAGFGRADKKAIEKMVRLQLHLDDFLQQTGTPVIDDTFDALAVLLTHVGSRGLQKSLNAF